MDIYNKIIGEKTIDESIIEEYLINDEEIIIGYKFIRDSIILTNLGIYMIDVQGILGKKVEVKFIPAKSISNVSVETTGAFDLIDIKIGVHNNYASVGGNIVSVPIAFKVDSDHTKEGMQIVRLIKENYLCN